MKRFIKKGLSLLLAVVMIAGMLPATTLATEPMTIGVSSQTGLRGDTVSVDIRLVNNPGIAGASFDVEYSSDLTLTGVRWGYAISAAGSTATSQTMQSPYRLMWVGGTRMFSSDDIYATLTFKISNDARENTFASVRIIYDEDEVFDINDNNVPCNIVNGGISILSCVPGDINGDQKVNSKDVSRLMQYLANWDVEVVEATLDVNGDSKVNSKDVSRLMQYLAHWDVAIYPIANTHVMEVIAAAPATCTENGNTAYYHCTDCGKYFSDERGFNEITLESTVIPSTGHTVEVIPYVAPTETTWGSEEGSRCSVCGEILVDPTPIEPLAPETYNIQYVLHGNYDYLRTVDIENDNFETYSSSTGIEHFKDIDTKGFTFLGWFTQDGYQVTSIAKGSTGNKVLYAKWRLDTYHVTFDSPDVPFNNLAEDGSRQEDYTILTGLSINKPSWYGYTFVGWSDDNGFIVDTIKPGTYAQNLTLHANWTSDRNKATSYASYGDPIIIEDDINNQFLFVYDIGKISDVPLSVVSAPVKSNAFHEEREYTVSNHISKSTAEDITRMVADATTRSSGWTLSEDWNNTYSSEEETGTKKIKTDTRTDIEGNTVGGNYFVSNSKGGSSFMSVESGGSRSSSSRVTTDTSYGINNSHDHETDTYADAKLSVENKTEAGVKVGLPIDILSLGAEVKNTTTVSSEVSSGRRDHDATHVDTSYSNRIGTDNSSSSSSYYNTTANQSSNWNSTEGYEKSYSTSSSTEIQNAVSNEIAQTTRYNVSGALGGANSQTETVSGVTSSEEGYSNSIAYDEGTETTTTITQRFDADTPGYYRIVNAGTIHVYGVVGYDVATSSYYTYTYNVLDDERHLMLDYCKDSTLFDDCENGLVTFEIPYEVEEYVVGVTSRTDGLEVDFDGNVTDFEVPEEFNGTVSVPWYYVNKGDGSFSAHKTNGIAPGYYDNKNEYHPGPFENNTEIETLVLPMYVETIPANAFRGCTNLKHVYAFGITEIGENAFAGCVSLEKFSIDDMVVTLGDNAFDGVTEIAVKAANKNVADAAINSGAKRITVDIALVGDAYDNAAVSVPEGTEYFALISDGRTYTDFAVESKADETFISNMTFADNKDIALDIYSANVTLARVSVVDAEFLTLVLRADNTNLVLFGNVSLDGFENTMMSKNLTLTKLDAGVIGKIDLSGNLLINGSISNSKLITINGDLISITDSEFDARLVKHSISFDANDGSFAEGEITSKDLYLDQRYGAMPVPVRDHYTFDGWFTDVENGIGITTQSAFSVSDYPSQDNLTLYAHWTLNEFTVNFDANGGTVSPASKNVIFGETYGELPTPTRDHYTFNGWYTSASGGDQVTADSVFSATDDVTLYAHWNITPYTITWNDASNCTITVTRTSAPLSKASTGNLTKGSYIYYGDVLSISYTAATGYSVSTHGIESATVSGNIDSSSIKATATANSYTYNVVYKSSNGTSLGSTTVTEKYGTSKTISAPSKSGYNTPEPQTVVWDSTSAKTITFVYPVTPVSYTNKNGNVYDGMSYSAQLQYQNRTANSVQVRIVWTSTIASWNYNPYGQQVDFTAGGQTKKATVAAYNSDWKNQSSSARSKTGTTEWITVSLNTTNATTVSTSVYYWEYNSNWVNMNAYDGPDVSASWTMNIPAY